MSLSLFRESRKNESSQFPYSLWCKNMNLKKTNFLLQLNLFHRFIFSIKKYIFISLFYREKDLKMKQILMTRLKSF